MNTEAIAYKGVNPPSALSMDAISDPLPNTEPLSIDSHASHISSDDVGTGGLYDTERRALISYAESCGREGVIKSFHSTYLDKVIQTAYGKWSNAEIVRRLELALEARKEVHEIERNMDNGLFETLMTNGSFVLSGRDRRSRKPLMWVDSGEFHKGCWRYRRGTRAFNAHLRARVWMIEVAEHAAAKSGFNGHIMVVSERTRANLDFNYAILSETFRLLTQTFPFTMFATNGFPVRIAGTFWGLPVAIKVVEKILGRKTKSVSFIDYEDATDMVEDSDDIPEFWYDDGNGKFFDETSLDVDTAWCYTRCMSEDIKISLQEILSPVECQVRKINRLLHSSYKKKERNDAPEPIGKVDWDDDVRTNKARAQPTPRRDPSHTSSDHLADRSVHSSYKKQERKDTLEPITEEDEDEV